jgi:hypothetical protein
MKSSLGGRSQPSLYRCHRPSRRYTHRRSRACPFSLHGQHTGGSQTAPYTTLSADCSYLQRRYSSSLSSPSSRHSQRRSNQSWHCSGIGLMYPGRCMTRIEAGIARYTARKSTQSNPAHRHTHDAQGPYRHAQYKRSSPNALGRCRLHPHTVSYTTQHTAHS